MSFPLWPVHRCRLMGRCTLLNRDVVLRRRWIDVDCLPCSLYLLLPTTYAISPPSPLSVSHTIGILLGTGAFWIILFFFIFALGSSFFLWPALVDFHLWDS